MDSKQLEQRKKLIYDFICDEIYVPMKLKELAILLQVPKTNRDELREVMDALIAEGKVELTKKGKYVKSEKKYLVAVQREASKSKFLKLCSDSKISTIDNIDSEIGKISLSMLIKDESIVGNYGVGENVTDLMPFSK